MNNKNSSLEKFRKLCEVKYTGTTPRTYHDQVKLFLDFCDKPPLKISNEDILNYNIHIRNYGTSYRNIAINAIKAFFKLYLRKEVKGFSSIRPKKEIRATKYFNYGLVKSKVLSVDNLKHRAILAIGLMGWLRVGEVLSLKIQDIRGDINVIRVLNSKGAKDRDVVMNDELFSIIKEYGNTHLKGYPINSFLFQGQKGGKYSMSSCNALVKTHINTEMRFHDLRATGSTNAHIKGVSLLDISTNLGHAKLETTKFYIPEISSSLLMVG